MGSDRGAYRDRWRIIWLAAILTVLLSPSLAWMASAQVDGHSYVSPLYGWSISWDDEWTVHDQWSDPERNYDSLSIANGLGVAYFDSYPGFDGDPGECVSDDLNSLEDIADDGKVSLARDGDGRPIQGHDKYGAYAVYLFSITDDEGARVDLVEYSDCRTLIEGEAVLEISQVVVRETYNDGAGAFQRLLANLAMPGEEPVGGPDGGERGAPNPADEDLTARQAKRLVDDIVVDLVDWWTEVFADHELFYVEPFFVVVENRLRMPCTGGVMDPGAGSFYCPLNQTIYFDLSTELSDAEGYGRSSVYYTLGHEAGHDVQLQLGVIQRGIATVEMELEADCMAGAYLAHVVEEDELTENEFFELLDLVATFGDPKGVPATDDQAHGLGSQRVGMVMRGYHSGIDACGTF